MSHNRKKLSKTAVSALALTSLLLPITAHAAINSPEGRSATYKTSLAAVEGLDERVLDWRNPTLEFSFDASDTDWTDGIELLLSADPLGNVSRNTPLMVQFNNGQPTPVITRGQGFDARLQFNPALIRPRNNIVTFSYNIPAGETCLAPQHGGWRLDFANSMIIIKARAKARNFDIREIDTRLKNPMTAPKSVRILARGQNTSALQALAAQGIGLRMSDIPEFKTSASYGELDIIMGRRDQLSGWVTDKDILLGTGPRIAAHKGRNMRLVITGDTDAEVLETAKSFATFSLPDAHRGITSLGEMNMQANLSSPSPRIEKTSKLTDISKGYFSEGWGPRPQLVKFNVADPIASTGEVLLRIASEKVVAPNSRVSVELNGKSLGFSTLNKSRKSVAFDIPAGTLQGTDNVLSITPDLEVRNLTGCNFVDKRPGFYLGGGSKLTIETDAASPVAELSKLTATGAPFSLNQGRDTVVMLPAASGRDYNASLKLLAKLAQSSGHGWTEANYMRSTNLNVTGDDKNVLVIGPSNRLGVVAKNGAPKSLTSALKGKSLSGTNRIASIDRFASSDEGATLKLYAQRQAQAGRISRGGVAALFPAPNADGNVIGVITNVPGRSFAAVAKQLIQPMAWNRLEGSVSRWDGTKVVMAQTAMVVPGFALETPKTSKLDGVKGAFAALTDFEWPKLSLPELNRGFKDFNDIETPDMASKLQDLKLRAAAVLGGQKTDKVISPRLKPTPKATAVPALRGFSKVPSAKTNANWRESFSEWKSNAQTKLGQLWNKRNSTPKISGVKSEAAPFGENLKRKVGGIFPEGSKGSIWANKLMATPAFLVLIGLGLILLILSLFAPNPKSRQRR